MVAKMEDFRKEIMLENLPGSATLYVKNKNELDSVGATNNLRGLAANIKFISEIVTQDDEDVKQINSDRVSDVIRQRYGDTKDLDYSPKYPSKIVNVDGSPKIMYHGSQCFH